MLFIDLHEYVYVGMIGGGRGQGVLEMLKTEVYAVGSDVEEELEVMETEGEVTVEGVEGEMKTKG